MDQTNDIDAIVDELRADAVSSSAPKEDCMAEIQKLNDENSCNCLLLERN